MYTLNTTNSRNVFGKANNWSKGINFKTYFELPF